MYFIRIFPFKKAVSSTRQQIQSNSKVLDLLPPASTFTGDKPTVLEWTLRSLPGVGHAPRKYQHTLSLAASKARLDSLKQPANETTLARLLSVSAPLASAWIGAIPKNKLTTLPNKAYSNAARYTLGLPYANAPAVQNCVCNYKNACTDIHHPLSCLKVRKLEVNFRHDTLNFIGHKFFRKLGLPAQIESQNIGGTQQRADTHVTDKDGESFLLDWSVVQPTCPSHVKAGSHKVQLHTATRAAGQKHVENDSWAKDQHSKAIALVAETTGAWTKEAHDFFKRITRSDDPSCCMPRRELLADLISSLAVAIQRGNHRIVTRVHSMIRQAAHSTSHRPLVHGTAKSTNRRQPHSHIDLTDSPSPVPANVQSQAPSDGFGVVDERADPMQIDDHQLDADTAINADGAVIGPLLLPQFIQFVLRPSDEQHADRSIDSDSTTFPEDNVSEADDPDYVLPEDSVRARDSELSRDDGSAHQHDTRSQRRRHAA